jgi:hypothetical protein
MAALSVMVNLEIPHVNILSKVHIISEVGMSPPLQQGCFSPHAIYALIFLHFLTVHIFYPDDFSFPFYFLFSSFFFIIFLVFIISLVLSPPPPRLTLTHIPPLTRQSGAFFQYTLHLCSV